MEQARAKKTEHFYSLCKEGMKVLDVGVSPETNDSLKHRNYFLKTFQFPSQYYTGLGVGGMSGVQNSFPEKKIVQYDGDVFPFQDKEFDWIFCNATIEHVGEAEKQIRFINEMLRVADRVFSQRQIITFPWNHIRMFRFCTGTKGCSVAGWKGIET
ncbi:MAG: class I SAM-dependent methyltransferase [Thermoleophilia bacterium]